MRNINELIWHSTATPEGREVSVAEIDRWHRERKFNGIGYHKVVHLDGSVSPGRDEHVKGAHVRGHNENTIGYAYVGGVSADDVTVAKDTRTPAQKATMRRLTQGAIRRYGLKKISGHRDYAKKACPCFDARAEYAPLLRKEHGGGLTQSRIVRGAGITTATGAGVAGDGFAELYNSANSASYHFSVGGFFQIAMGLLVIGGSLYALYARWDDAGRPSLREILRSG